jgi:hypothetical protein
LNSERGRLKRTALVAWCVFYEIHTKLGTFENFIFGPNKTHSQSTSRLASSRRFPYNFAILLLSTSPLHKRRICKETSFLATPGILNSEGGRLKGAALVAWCVFHVLINQNTLE